VYVIVQNLNVPLILQPQLFCTFALVSWGQVRNVLAPNQPTVLNKSYFCLLAVSILRQKPFESRIYSVDRLGGRYIGLFRSRNGFRLEGQSATQTDVCNCTDRPFCLFV
jgi:hypothetical protein